MRFDFFNLYGGVVCGGLTEKSPAVCGDGKVDGMTFRPAGSPPEPAFKRRSVKKPTELQVGEAVRVTYAMDDPSRPVERVGKSKSPQHPTYARTYVLVRTA